MMNLNVHKNSNIYVYVLIGLISGVLLDLLYRYEVTYVYIWTVILTAPLFFALTWNGKNTLSLLITSLLTVLIVSLPTLPFHKEYTLYSLPQTLVCMGALPWMFFIAYGFHYALHHHKWRGISYPTLFTAIWNAVPMLIVGLIFYSIASGLIMLAAAIFKTVGSDWLWYFYFQNQHVRLISWITLFYIGLGIGQQNHQIIYNMRMLFLRISYYLLPLIAVMTIIYYALYLTHPEPNPNHYLDEAFFIFLALSALGIIFLNGYIQDGREPQRYGHAIHWLIRVYRVVLLFLLITLASRFFEALVLPLNAKIVIITSVLYGICYALSALVPSRYELSIFTKGNIFIALFFLLAMLIINNPIRPIGYDAKTGAIPDVLKPGFPKNDALINPVIQNAAKTRVDEMTNDLSIINIRFEKQAGQTIDGLSFCRAAYHFGWQLGIVKNNECIITYQGQSLSLLQFDYINGINQDDIQWLKNNQDGLVLGVEIMPSYFNPRYSQSNYQLPHPEVALSDLSICRVKQGDLYVYGKRASSRCYVSANQVEQSFNDYEVLALKPKLSGQLMQHQIDTRLKNNGFYWAEPEQEHQVVAADIGSDVLGICRTSFGGALEVGVLVDHLCRIIHQGQVMDVARFDVLSNNQQVYWQENRGFERNPKQLAALGYIINASLQPQEVYACRVIYRDKIYAGVLFNFNCMIADETKPVVVPGGQILLYQKPVVPTGNASN